MPGGQLTFDHYQERFYLQCISMDACDIFMNFNIGQYLSIYFLIPKAKSCQLPDRLEQCSNPPRKKALWQNSSGGIYF